MREFVWPDIQAILDDHRDAVGLGHGLTEQRARDAIEAGYTRARSANYESASPDVAEVAAHIFQSIALRHPLVDMNKQTGLLCMAVFLECNGVIFDPPELALFNALDDVVTKRSDAAQLARFIASHCAKLPKPRDPASA